MLIADALSKSGEMSDWTREFAEIALPVCMNPRAEMVLQAISTHLPEQLVKLSPSASVEELLEQVLGISVIVQYGREQIGWITTTNPVSADVLQQLYSSEPYSKARQDMGIDGHWIFLVNPELIDIYGVDELMAAEPYPIEMYERYPNLLSLKYRQECVIVNL